MSDSKTSREPAPDPRPDEESSAAADGSPQPPTPAPAGGSSSQAPENQPPDTPAPENQPPEMPSPDDAAPDNQAPENESPDGQPPGKRHPSEDATVISKRPPVPAVESSGSEPSMELAQNLEGQMLDHFRLEEFLGGGGMGAVFRALDTRLERHVALKVLRRGVGDDQESVRRFQNEARSTAQLDHDNIARVYYVGIAAGHHYIAFELIDGVNLRDLVLQKGPLSVDTALGFTLATAEALDHASSRHVVHRDIKPSNLLITPEGKVKLVDMGLSRLHDVEQRNNDLTASGVTLGTFDYISPEQALDPRGADVRSDIYSLGCTLYFMLTGRPPFPEGNPFQKLLRHKGDDPPDPREFAPNIPDDLVRIMRKMLAKDPGRRYQTPAELMGDLVVLMHKLGVPTSSAAMSRAVVPRPSKLSWLQKHVPWMVPAAALLLILALVELAPRGGAVEPPQPPEVSEVDAATPNLARTNPGGGQPEDDPRSRPDDPGEPTQDTANNNPPEEGSPEDEPAPRVEPTEDVVEEPRAETIVADDPGPAVAPVLAVGAAPGATTDPEPEPQGVTVGPAEEGGTSVLGDMPDKPGELTAARPSDRGEGSPESGGPSENTLVVGEGGAFDTLEKAWKAADSAQEIVLKTGRVKVSPLVLSNKDLTVRAHEDFQPVLVFEPDEAGDFVGYPRTLITIVGGELVLEGVDVEVNFPSREPSNDHWALFASEGARGIHLRRSVLTIRNVAASTGGYFRDFHEHVAFFDVKRPPGTSMRMDMMGSSQDVTSPEVEITLEDCIARGEAVLLRCGEMQPVRFFWRNGLLATSRHLLLATGGQKAAPADARLRVELEHVTAFARDGLCYFTSRPDPARPEQPHHLTAEVRSKYSILMVGEDASLVEQYGEGETDAFRERFVWEGNRNFYERVDSFCKVTSVGSLNDPVVDDYESWQQWWGDREKLPHLDQVMWSRTERPVPASALEPKDFKLSESGDNPARNVAFSSPRDAGFDPAALPEPPSEERDGERPSDMADGEEPMQRAAEAPRRGQPPTAN